MAKEKYVYTPPTAEVFLLGVTSVLDTLSMEGDAPNYEYGGEFEGETYYEW